MASNKALLLLVLCSFLLPACNARDLRHCRFDAIYQLGDSISDTGNLIRENPSSQFARLPYGETFFHKATGRCSNGLLMIDYFAQSAGLPFLEPYLNRDASFAHGVNFAVAGATALSSEVLVGKGVPTRGTNISLSKQLDWMFAHFNRTCFHHQDCSEKLKKSLFMVGEIGGNDYNYALLGNKTIEEVKAMVPQVVQSIKNAVTRVIGYGASRVIVPGNFPVGCLPIYLTAFQTKSASTYDRHHCLKDYNKFAMYHNKHLKQAISQLREEHRNVVIVYADYYKAFQWVLGNDSRFRFDPNSAQKACCGIGGDYNFSLTRYCGDPGVPVCPNPDEHISWDGVHLTHKAYKMMARYILHHICPKLQCYKFTD